MLFKLCFSPQKRCSSELKSSDSAAYNVTYPIVNHVVTWAESWRETTAPERINSILTHYSEGQMKTSISKARGRNYDLACLCSFILVCTITTIPCLNEVIVLKSQKPGKTNIPIINRRAVLLVNSHCLLLIKVFSEYFLNLGSLGFYLFTWCFPIEIQVFL